MLKGRYHNQINMDGILDIDCSKQIVYYVQ